MRNACSFSVTGGMTAVSTFTKVPSRQRLMRVWWWRGRVPLVVRKPTAIVWCIRVLWLQCAWLVGPVLVAVVGWRHDVAGRALVPLGVVLVAALGRRQGWRCVHIVEALRSQGVRGRLRKVSRLIAGTHLSWCGREVGGTFVTWSIDGASSAWMDAKVATTRRNKDAAACIDEPIGDLADTETRGIAQLLLLVLGRVRVRSMFKQPRLEQVRNRLRELAATS